MLSRLVDARVDPRPLAVARVLIGLAAMVMAFDSRSLLGRIAVPGKLRLPTASWLPEPSAAVADAVFVALLVAGAALAAGVLARLAAGACAVLAVLPMAIDHQAYSNHGVLLAALGTLLALAEPAAAFSPRASSWRGEPRSIPYWPLFLMKAQVSTLYGWAAIAKLNESYLTDETLRVATAGWARDLVPDLAFGVAAVIVLLVEAFLAAALWWRRTRAAAYVIGVALHGGLVLFGWAPLGLVPFAMLTIAPYPLFLQDPVWRQGGLPSHLAAQLLPARMSRWPTPASATPMAKNDQL